MLKIEVIYETMPGWLEDISKCRNFKDLPVNAQRYVLRMQERWVCPFGELGAGQTGWT